jgi:hypothetical protein
MKTFQGNRIIEPTAPMPKVGQIWHRTKTNELVKVIDITKTATETIQCTMLTEGDDKITVGLGWLDNIAYVFIGTVN